MGIAKPKFETLEGYLTATLLMMAVVAWRAKQVKIAARLNVDSSCENYFEPAEWKPAYMVVKKTRVLPSMAEFTILLPQLRGYLKKRRRGSPGAMTIWRGLRKLEAYREAYIVFGHTRKRKDL